MFNLKFIAINNEVYRQFYFWNSISFHQIQVSDHYIQLSFRIHAPINAAWTSSHHTSPAKLCIQRSNQVLYIFESNPFRNQPPAYYIHLFFQNHSTIGEILYNIVSNQVPVYYPWCQENNVQLIIVFYPLLYIYHVSKKKVDFLKITSF